MSGFYIAPSFSCSSNPPPPNPTNCLFLWMLQWNQLPVKIVKKAGKNTTPVLTFLKYELLILLVHLVFVQLSTESIKTFCSTITIVILRPNYLHNWNLEVLMNSSLYNAVHHKYGQEQFRGLYSFFIIFRIQNDYSFWQRLICLKCSVSLSDLSNDWFSADEQKLKLLKQQKFISKGFILPAFRNQKKKSPTILWSV